MRKVLLSCALILAFAAAASAAPCNPKKNSLPAPTGFTATSDSDSVDASWTAVPGATKYSVEVTAHYNGCALEEEFEFTVFAPATTISIPLSELTTCIDLLCTGGPISAEGVEIKVKALNPPQGRNGLAQCNPFTPTVSVDFCGDGVDGDCDETIDDGCVGDACIPGACTGGIWDATCEGGSCFCWVRVDGGGECASDHLCANFTTGCNSNADCAADEACINSCCPTPGGFAGYCAPTTCSAGALASGATASGR